MIDGCSTANQLTKNKLCKFHHLEEFSLEIVDNEQVRCRHFVTVDGRHVPRRLQTFQFYVGVDSFERLVIIPEVNSVEVSLLRLSLRCFLKIINLLLPYKLDLLSSSSLFHNITSIKINYRFCILPPLLVKITQQNKTIK